MKSIRILVVALLVLATTSFVAFAQEEAVEKPWVIEALVGGAVPTFDIRDVVSGGPVVGAAIGYAVNPKVLVLAEFDYGSHDGQSGGPKFFVYHYMAKAGYLVYKSEDTKFRIYVNAGLGAMTFDPDVDGATSNTYFAINAGAKLYYTITETLSAVLSPQGDIAFTSTDDGFPASTAWVWPLTAGIAFTF